MQNPEKLAPLGVPFNVGSASLRRLENGSPYNAAHERLSIPESERHQRGRPEKRGVAQARAAIGPPYVAVHPAGAGQIPENLGSSWNRERLGRAARLPPAANMPGRT